MAPAADLSRSYQWAPVRIGGGGWATGFVSHPLNANVRYCRTDVAGAYRWDAKAQEWFNMLVRNDDGSGVPADVAARPMGQGVSSIAVDPTDVNVVYMVFPVVPYKGGAGEAKDLKGRIYRSADGGRNFARLGDLDLAAEPNGPNRMHGERLMVDPNNPKVLYYGSDKDGLWRSTDGGQKWLIVTAQGAPAAKSDVLNVRIAKSGGTVNVLGTTVSKVVYCDTTKGDVFASINGGQSWSNITKGTALSGNTMQMVIAPNGHLWAGQWPTAIVWKYDGSAWTSVDTAVPDQQLENVAVDPNNPQRIFALGGSGTLSRSLDGGKTWTPVSDLMRFANKVGWTPAPGYRNGRSCSGVFFDKDGTLWVPQGDDGIVFFKPSADNSESTKNPPKWTIQCQGIEEMCMLQAVIPPGSGDKVFLAGMDEIGMYITDPDKFTAVRAMLHSGMSLTRDVDFVPNEPSVLVAASSDSFWTMGGRNYSGYSTDYGKTWKRFPSVENQLTYADVPGEQKWPNRPLMENKPLGVATKKEPPGAPEPPSDMKVTVVSPSEVQITWKRNSDNELGFRISYWPWYARWAYQLPHTKYLEVPPGTTGVNLKSQLLENTAYKFSISAFNDNGDAVAATGWELWGPPEHSGAIAVSRRDGWGTGADHIVHWPGADRPPMYSKDGGTTWKYSPTFPVGEPDQSGNVRMRGKRSMLAPWTNFRPLLSDPFVPDKFYLKFTDEGPELDAGHWGNALWISTDGGVNWAAPKGPGILPNQATLRANYKVKDDLWACGVNECVGGQGHGVYHSTDGGLTFIKVGDFDTTCQIGLGAGSGKPGDAPYSVYVYGTLKGDARFGIFRSTDAGRNWDRISYYPAGNFNGPTSLAASWDTFGLVYVTFGGSGAAYGKPVAAAP